MKISLDDLLKKQKLFMNFLHSVLMILIKMLVRLFNIFDRLNNTHNHLFGGFLKAFKNVFIG